MYWKILLSWFNHTSISERWVLPPFKINRKAGTHDWELIHSGERFTYWKIPFFANWPKLGSEWWIIFPFRMNTKSGTHDQELINLGERFTYWQILLFWFTQCLTPVRDGFSSLLESKHRLDPMIESFWIFRWRIIFRHFEKVSTQTQNHFKWSGWTDLSIQTQW